MFGGFNLFPCRLQCFYFQEQFFRKLRQSWKWKKLTPLKFFCGGRLPWRIKIPYLDRQDVSLSWQPFQFYLLKQISMTVQVIPVRTTGHVQTEWTVSTAAVHQDLMAHNVKQVTIAKIHFSSGALPMSLAVFLFSRAILQESDAKLEIKKNQTPSIFVWR